MTQWNYSTKQISNWIRIENLSTKQTNLFVRACILSLSSPRVRMPLTPSSLACFSFHSSKSFGRHANLYSECCVSAEPSFAVVTLFSKYRYVYAVCVSVFNIWIREKSSWWWFEESMEAIERSTMTTARGWEEETVGFDVVARVWRERTRMDERTSCTRGGGKRKRDREKRTVRIKSEKNSSSSSQTVCVCTILWL